MKQLIIGIALLLAVVVSAVAIKNVISGDLFTPINSPAPVALGGEASTVKVRMEGGYNYIMEPAQFTVGQPVRMVFDMKTVTGCMRSVVIPAFGVRKTISERDNIVEFTPDKTGEFKITCSMGMGRGTFTVVGGSGASAVKVDDAINQVPGGGSCGTGGAGCGCGGG